MTSTAPNLITTSKYGIGVVAGSTKYLSTLPHNVDIVEEQVSLCSVISSLLIALNDTINRFNGPLSHSPSQRQPVCITFLCHDVFNSFACFTKYIREAQSLRVFEPSSSGVVRNPREAWMHVVGGERKTESFINRLHVEKYRIRVLIDAFTWRGLKNIGPMERTAVLDKEMQVLNYMLPVIVERLGGIWKDYGKRLQGVERRMEYKKLDVATISGHSLAIEESKRQEKGSGVGDMEVTVRSCNSTNSLASVSSSATLAEQEDVKYRCFKVSVRKASRVLSSATSIFGLTVVRRYKYATGPCTIEPVPADSSEIQSLLNIVASAQSCCSEQLNSLQKKARSELKRMVSSSQTVEDVSIVHQEAFEFEGTEAQLRMLGTLLPVLRRTWLKRMGGRELDQWLLIMPEGNVNNFAGNKSTKWGDRTSPREVPQGTSSSEQMQRSVVPMTHISINVNGVRECDRARHTLKRVEQRQRMSVEEAEKKMELYEPLFGLRDLTKGETRVPTDKTEKSE